jgi:hypothetical protein
VFGILALLLQAAVLPSTVHGTVVSQDGLPVSGARVELSCQGQTAETTTSDAGAFAIIRPVAGSCALAVTRSGFATVNRVVDAHESSVGVVQLSIEGHQERVTVRGAVPPSFVNPIGSVVLSSDDIVASFDRSEDVIRHAIGLITAAPADAAIYVDGLPATMLPPLDNIRQVTALAGPFAAEYGDGDGTTVLVTTRPPARQFRVSPGGSVLALGGGDGLRPSLASQSSHQSFSASGPVPWFPVTWSSSLTRSRYEKQLALVANVPSTSGLEMFEMPSENANAASSGHAFSFSSNVAYAAAGGTGIRGAFSEARSTGSNAGVGGIVLPSAGFASTSLARAIHVTASVPGRRLLVESGLVARASSSSYRANSATRGINVMGEILSGGAPFNLEDSHRVTSTARFVVRQPSQRGWSTGVISSTVSLVDNQVPNPHGMLQLESWAGLQEALAGAPTATWVGARGNGRAAYRGITIAPFVQRALTTTKHLHVEAGVRADFQSGYGFVLSPRVWSASAWKGFVMQAGSGFFVHEIPATVFLKVLQNDGDHLEQFVATAVTLATDTSNSERQQAVRTTVATDLGRTRQLMNRVAIERRIADITPSLEYTWSRDTHRLGAERTAAGNGWLDVIASNRSAVRHTVRGRVVYRHGRQSFAGIYEWLRAFDDGDGPFAYSERPNNLAAEWARTTGLPPHAVGVVSNLTLPLNIHVTVSDRWQSGAPYNVTAANDVDGNGLFVDRLGAPRNSARSPDQHLMSMVGSIRGRVPTMLRRLKAPQELTLNIHIENVLNSSSYTAMGSVMGSSLFGRPIGAMAGRSMRLTVTLN